MELPHIMNIYYIDTLSGEPFYFFSVKKKDNSLSFSYYMLFKKDNIPEIKRLNKTLEFLQNKQLKLNIVDRNSDAYREFARLLYLATYEPEPNDTNRLIKRK